MPHIQQKTVYYFDELSDSAKDTARQWWRNGAFDYEWYDSVFEDAQQCLAYCGLDVEKIYFSGFSSQGDGACFNGTWSAGEVNAVNLKAHASQDRELHRLVDAFAAIAKEYSGSSISFKHSGHYYHPYCTKFSDFEVSEDDLINSLDYGAPEYRARESLIFSAEQEVIELCRDSMKWVYRQLEREWDFQNADEQVDENIRANEYEFLEDGRRAA